MLSLGHRSHFKLVCVFVFLLLPFATAQAALIYENAGGWRITGSGNDDGSPASVVVHPGPRDVLLIEITKVFVGRPDRYGYLPAIFLNFTQVNPDASTASKIVILDEDIQNNTARDWIDFHWYLFGYGNARFNTAETFPSDYKLPGDNFNLTPFSGRSWSSQGTGPGEVEALNAFTGVVSKGDSFTPGGGPNGGELVIDVDLTAARPGFFILKELPTIPEPATLFLVTIGAALLIRRRRIT